MHYKRMQRTGVTRGADSLDKFPNVGPCAVSQCERPAITRGYCEAHYQRMLRGNGDLITAVNAKRSPGSGGKWIDRSGYVILTLPSEGGRRISEHRYVMEKHLGRQLRSDESVHHINGVRSDNRIENLELWVTSQPSGQRVEDIVRWAKEILTRYDGQ